MTFLIVRAMVIMTCLSLASAFMGAPICRGNSVQARIRSGVFPSSTSQVMMKAKVENVAAIVLAGGAGKRMKADKPKQLLELGGQPVLDHSLELFRSLKSVSRLIVVLGKEHRHEYESLCEKDSRIVFADPGEERQDSVFNALQKVDVGASLVCIHDAARPLVRKKDVRKVLKDAMEHGAAVLGMPMKCTVKESEDGEFVLRTIDRTRLWEIQTPQVAKLDMLKKGFEESKKQGWVVTDDASIIEQLGIPVKLTRGDYTNLKLTTPEDMVVASQILESQRKMGASADGDDDDDDDEERLSVTRANEKWSDRPRGAKVPSAEDQVENLSSKRANEQWSTRSSTQPPAAGAAQEDMGPENLSAKRADAGWAGGSSGQIAVDGTGDASGSSEKKSLRDRPPPERVSPNRTPPPKPADMDVARADLRAKREALWKEKKIAPPSEDITPPPSEGPPAPQKDIFSKE